MNMNLSKLGLTENIMAILEKNDIPMPEQKKLTEKPVAEQGKYIMAHYLGAFLEKAAEIEEDGRFDLRYDSLYRLPGALAVFIRSLHPDRYTIAKTLACIFYALAMQEHGCSLHTVRAKSSCPSWEGGLSLKLGKKREIDFLPACLAALDSPIGMDSGVFLSMGQLNKDYRSALGVDPAEKGLTDIMLSLSCSTGVNEDEIIPTTIEDSLLLAPQGNIYAMTNLAIAYLDGHYGIKRDYVKAREWFEKLAERGDSDAMFNLGILYAKGCGVPRDFVSAAEWLEKAAAAGDKDAPELAKNIGMMPELLKKAECGDSRATAELAEKYMMLAMVKKPDEPTADYKECLRLAKSAAESGNAKAMWLLGLCYEKGRGVVKSSVSAFKWYQKSAELGYPQAQTNLGCMYGRGEGVKKDEALAQLWLRRAAEGGDKNAVNILRGI